MRSGVGEVTPDLNVCCCGQPSVLLVVTFCGYWLIECCETCAMQMVDPLSAPSRG